jgi:CubicO group peptidase (beta-lactamase class C family)
LLQEDLFMRRALCPSLAAVLVSISLPLLAGCGDEAGSPPATEETFAERMDAGVGAWMQKAVDDGKIPGGVVRVEMLDGSGSYGRAFGLADREKGVAYEEDALVRIASMTKPITSAAVMILVDDGKISLDDPLGKYLPEWKSPTVLGAENPAAPLGHDTAPATKPLTVRSLITHTAGISYRFMGPPLGPLYAAEGITDGFQHTELTLAEQSEKLAKMPLLHEPGDHYDYGLNIDVLGRLIEVASGTTLDAFLATRIFAPLGMKDTSFYPPAEEAGRMPVLYRRAANGGLEPVPADGMTNATDGENAIYAADFQTAGAKKYLSGGAGLVSTAADYALFLRMIAGGGELDGDRILTTASVQLMTEDQIGPEMRANFYDSGFGLGFAINDDPARAAELGSAGTYFWAGIFKTRFWVDPQTRLYGICITQLWDLADSTMDACPAEVYEALAAQSP